MTTPDESQGQQQNADGTANNGQQQEPPVNNPPYWEDLQTLPEDVRPLAEPLFKKWDSGVTQRIQQVHSEYEPWKSVIDSYEPETVSQALQLAQLIESDPKAVWDLMAQTYNFAAEQGQQQNQDPSNPNGEVVDEEDPYAERFGKLESNIEQLAQYVIGSYNEQTTRQQTEALDKTLTELREKHGDFDEDYVLNRIVLGDEPEDAVKMYQSVIEKALQAKGIDPATITQASGNNGGGAPIVAGADGGTPSVLDGGKRPAELTNGEVEGVVAQMLKDAAAANN